LKYSCDWIVDDPNVLLAKQLQQKLPEIFQIDRQVRTVGFVFKVQIQVAE